MNILLAIALVVLGFLACQLVVLLCVIRWIEHGFRW